jgi:hypothetical protein
MKGFDGDMNLADKFQARLTLTDRWATWRHLDRALSPSRTK